MPIKVNSYFIVLIPKSQNPTSFNHYKPIGLCNVVYKVISKLLVFRLMKILHKLISPTQATFILGRWIAENHIVVQEMLYGFKTRKIKFGLMADKTRFHLISMFLVSTMDDVEILFTRNKQYTEDTDVGSTREPPMLKLAYFSWNYNLYVIFLSSTYLLLLALYSLSESKCFVHLSS